MLDLIIEAVNNRKVLAFVYDGISRVVEPHTVGETGPGNTALRCYQTAGGHVRPGHDWDLCDLRKISQLQLTGATFIGPRAGYQRGDQAFRRIHAQL